MASMNPIDGSLGVVDALNLCSRPASSITRQSVNVPPTSTQMRFVLADMETHFLRCSTGAQCWRQPVGIYCSSRPTRGGCIVRENYIRSISNCQKQRGD